MKSPLFESKNLLGPISEIKMLYYVLFIYCAHVASPISSSTRSSTCLSAYLAVVFHPTWAEGEVEEGGRGEHPSAPLGTGVRAHETAAVLQKPIIEAPGPPPHRLAACKAEQGESVIVSGHR